MKCSSGLVRDGMGDKSESREMEEGEKQRRWCGGHAAAKRITQLNKYASKFPIYMASGRQLHRMPIKIYQKNVF